jgi:simple sugar transport system permease protein
MKALKIYLLTVLISIVAATLILVLLGENLSTLREALTFTFFNPFGLGYTLYYTTPLIFTGLSAALCFHAGLFNIGAEGQLLWGAMGIVVFSHLFPDLPSWLALPCGVFVSALFGGIWGFLAGYFKSAKGTHEVISTILLNFIALYFVNYLTLYTFKSPLTQAAETEVISHPYWLQNLFFPTTPLNTSIFIAVFLALCVHFFLFRTVTGFEIRTLGASPKVAAFSGISISKNTLLVFFLAGCLSGLVGTNEVMGNEHKVIDGFSPGYGFAGIAVALLARNSPIGILFTSFLFGSLQNISRELEFFGEHITKEVSLVLQAVLLIVIALINRGKNR